jgi:hypothetical protein
MQSAPCATVLSGFSANVLNHKDCITTQAADAELLYLPSYSADLAPMEQAIRQVEDTPTQAEQLKALFASHRRSASASNRSPLRPRCGDSGPLPVQA